MTTATARIPRQVPDWHEDAACRAFPEIDFVEAKGDQATAARIVCSVCPVQLTCAVSALERGEPWGIWGGLDRADRKAVAKEYGYPVPAMVPDHGTNARRVKHGCSCPECRQAHALYEAQRRERNLARARARGIVLVPTVAEPARIARPKVSRYDYRQRCRNRARRRR